ncbi:hypothetical protein BTN50_1613 (plasmid) [Candidatus Enterovibrio altilux]|uniref:Uncharacterized protein n=1 Tax=Candidatus Enterovibrio altilux TaxID=1927128 RepID=A0A291BAP2_9GAMM|nr:hypothetical protein BTN50_1613 [Candidatus Enterovibrio luxaltus]
MNIANKVNHSADGSQQEYLAGALSLITIRLTIAVMLIVLKQMIWAPWLFNLLLPWLEAHYPITSIS